MPTHVTSIEGLLARAIGHVNAGQPAQALALCRQAQADHPPHPAVLQLLAWLALQAGQSEEAFAQAEASLALRPDHAPTSTLAADAGFRCALARQDAGDLRGAETALQRVLQMRPEQVEAWVNLGIVRQQAGRFDAAFLAYAEAYRLREDSFGRIAHALAHAGHGAVWLSLDALRRELRAAGA